MLHEVCTTKTHMKNDTLWLYLAPKQWTHSSLWHSACDIQACDTQHCANFKHIKLKVYRAATMCLCVGANWESWSVQACADVEHILFLVNLCPWPGPVKPPCCMCIHFLPTHILPPCRTLCTHFLPSSAHILTIACCSLPEISPKVWAQTVHSQHRKHISFSMPAQSLPFKCN